MPKRQKADARLGDIKQRFLERAEELWDAHEDEFMAVLEDSESRVVRIGYSATLDFSESTAKLQTGINFSQVIRDRKEDDFDDPNQPKLLETDDEKAEKAKREAKAKKGAKGGRGRKKATETNDGFPSGKDRAANPERETAVTA